MTTSDGTPPDSPEDFDKKHKKPNLQRRDPKTGKVKRKYTDKAPKFKPKKPESVAVKPGDVLRKNRKKALENLSKTSKSGIRVDGKASLKSSQKAVVVEALTDETRSLTPIERLKQRELQRAIENNNENNLPYISEAERNSQMEVLIALARVNFYVFVRLMAKHMMGQEFVDGPHIKVVCDALQEAYETPYARLMVFLPPGAMKSVLGSKLFVAWIFGKRPRNDVLHIGHTADLIEGFSAETIMFMSSQEYKAIFPEVQLDPDFLKREHWKTLAKGSYRTGGAGTTIAGKRFNVGICDDLVSEKTAGNSEAMEKIYTWWPWGFEARDHPGGRLIMIQTRWALNDISGWLLKRAKENPSARQWKVVSIPAIINSQEVADLLELPIGSSFWPQFRPTDDYHIKRNEMPRYQWESLYQQNPVASDGNIFKQQYIQKKDANARIPKLTKVIASLDTAFSTRTTADFSVLQIWGVFVETREDGTRTPCTILLDQVRARLEYPDLVVECERLRMQWDPDVWVIEAKASGQSLIQDLRRRSFMVYEFKVERDKISRANAVVTFFEQRRVYFLDTIWSLDTIDELLAFPKGAHDDTVDATTQAHLYLRDSYLLTYVDEDFEDPEESIDYSTYDKPRKYYW